MHRLWMPLTLAALTHIPAFAQIGATTPPAGVSQRLPATSAPQPLRVLTLRDAIELAWSGHPELTAAKREIEAQDAARLQAGALPNPQLGFEVEDTRRQTRTTTVQLSQPIELGGKRSARIAAAERGRDIAEVQLAARRADIRASVAGAYFDALIAQERVRLAEAALQLAQGASLAAAKRVIAGKVSPVEETKAKVAEAGVRVELVQAHGELQTALHDLAAAMGSKGPVIERVGGAADELPSVPPAMELEQRLTASPALRLALLEVDRQSARVELERARRVPDLTVTLGAQRSEELGRNQALIGLSVPLPIFDTNRGNLLEALRRQDKAREEADAAAVRLRAEAQRALQRLSTARAEVEALRGEIVPGAQNAYDAATKGFELGKFSFLEALDAQRTLLQARTQYLRALAQAHRAGAELDRILGIDDALDGQMAR